MSKQTATAIHQTGHSSRAVPKYADLTEIQLIESTQQRDQAAFAYLVESCEHQVQGMLYRLAPEMKDLSDLKQEVFIRLWTSIGKLRNPYSFRTWLSHITTNVVYDEFRRRRHLTVSLDCSRYFDEGDEGSTLQIPDKSALPEELMDRSQLAQVIDSALANMPNRFQLMFVLRDQEGLSYKEIGVITHASLGTVKSRICRARKKMQVLVSPYLSVEEIRALKNTA